MGFHIFQTNAAQRVELGFRGMLRKVQNKRSQLHEGRCQVRYKERFSLLKWDIFISIISKQMFVS